MDTKQNEIMQVDDLFEKVERLPEKEREVFFEKLEIYHGDLPHPDILRGYNQLYPEAAKRIIENGIAETEHRRKMEENYLKGNLFAHRIGQILGFIVAIMIVGSGTFLIYSGHSVAGSIMTGATALGVIGLFTGQANQKK